jgi:hypothetical protein
MFRPAEKKKEKRVSVLVPMNDKTPAASEVPEPIGVLTRCGPAQPRRTRKVIAVGIQAYLRAAEKGKNRRQLQSQNKFANERKRVDDPGKRSTLPLVLVNDFVAEQTEHERQDTDDDDSGGVADAVVGNDSKGLSACNRVNG